MSSLGSAAWRRGLYSDRHARDGIAEAGKGADIDLTVGESLASDGVGVNPVIARRHPIGVKVCLGIVGLVERGAEAKSTAVGATFGVMDYAVGRFIRPHLSCRDGHHSKEG